MTTATRTHRTAGLSAEQRRARQDELLATLADGVLGLTTSQGWRRYLRAMTTLRTYSTGNSGSPAASVGHFGGPPVVVVRGGEGWQHAYPRSDLAGGTVRPHVDEVVSERSE